MSRHIALVLSGGGARGIAHIGVIEALEERGYTIRSVVGTSMGALVGGIYAMGKLPELKDWFYSLDKMMVFRLIDFSFSSQGLIKGDRVLDSLQEFMEDRPIESLNIPYRATTYDLARHQEVVFTQGSTFQAIRASIAIPTVLTPVMQEKSVLVDGGLVNNLPVSHAVRTSGDMLLAVYVNADKPMPGSEDDEKPADQPPTPSGYMQKIKAFQDYLMSMLPSDREKRMNYFDLINNTINVMTHQISMLNLQTHPPDLLIEISRDCAGTFDFYKAETLVDIGRKAAFAFLDDHQL